MATFPDDILRHIFSSLPQNTVLNCRLLNRASGYLATSVAFRHVRLEILCDPLPFVRISQSPQLRRMVREITIDAGPGLVPDESRAEVVLRNTKFLLALPRLNLFSALQTVNVKFTPFSSRGLRTNEQDPMTDVEEPSQHQSLQARVLSTIIKCMTGQWMQERHNAWQKYWLEWFRTRAPLHIYSGASSTGSGSQLTDLQLPFTPSGSLSFLSSLTIANLSDSLEHSLYKSLEFQSLLSSQPLLSLKLLVATERRPFSPPEHIFLPAKYDFFEQLPTTWLAPAFVSNLRVLSLYCHDYFGWAPKLDFRRLNTSNGLSAFPNLRVLALGKYVFSHDWQVEWVTSLGSSNGRGGLEELYLDDCPIMWRAHVLGPMDESTSDVDGVQLDNSGYPLKEVMTRRAPHDERWDPVTVDFDLRWNAVLRTWHDKMQALKVFKMGSGDWDGEHTMMVATAKSMDLFGDLESSMAEQPKWRRRCVEVVHLNYDKPSLAECLEHSDFNAAVQYGVGLRQNRENVLQYVNFHVGLQGWVERDFKNDMMDQYEDGWQRYGDSRKADEEAFRVLSEAVGSRSRK